MVLILASSLQTADNIIIQIKMPLYMNTIQFECYTNTRKITFLFEILKLKVQAIISTDLLVMLYTTLLT